MYSDIMNNNSLMKKVLYKKYWTMNLITEMYFENNYEKLLNNDGELNIISCWEALGKKGYCHPVMFISRRDRKVLSLEIAP